MAFVNLFRTRSSASRQGDYSDALETASLISALEADLRGADQLKALQGLRDMLREPNDRAATAQVLDTVSWDVFGLLMECFERPGEATPTPDSLPRDGRSGGEATTAQDLCQSILLLMADIVSPKELNLMALEHAQVYASPRSLRVMLSLLRRSLERMPPPQRSKFLDTSIQPGIGIIRRVAATRRERSEDDDSQGDEHDGDNDDDGDDDCDDGDGDGDSIGDNGARGKDDQGPGEGYKRLSSAGAQAAARAADMANGFVRPLLEQTWQERGHPGSRVGGSRHGTGVKGTDPAGSSSVGAGKGHEESVWAVNRSLACFLGYALSALGVASARVVCYAASEPEEKMRNATGRLLESIMMNSPASLQSLLEHRSRVEYARRRRRKLGEQPEETAPGGAHRGSCRVGEIMATAETSGDISAGVAILAHLVVCDSRVRAMWLPAVWSQRMQCRLFLPYAEDLMRSRSKRLRGRGLELACALAEGLGSWPEPAGGLSFAWRASDEDPDSDSAAAGAHPSAEAGEDATPKRRLVQPTPGAPWPPFLPYLSRSRRQEKGFNGPPPKRRGLLRESGAVHPYGFFDLGAFIQVLLDVVITCPLASLRGRGHAAMGTLLSACDERSRFFLIKHLVRRCPWPNATGLLLDNFRREVDQALRGSRRTAPGPPGRRNEDGMSSSPCAVATNGEAKRENEGFAGVGCPAANGRGEEDPGDCSPPFASPQAGDFVEEQLRRACATGPASLLLMDMDSRTGALILARYAHALERTCGGRLQLRGPQRLVRNRALVEGFLNSVRQCSRGDADPGPDHFRLFLLEDAAQNCLDELSMPDSSRA